MARAASYCAKWTFPGGTDSADRKSDIKNRSTHRYTDRTSGRSYTHKSPQQIVMKRPNKLTNRRALDVCAAPLDQLNLVGKRCATYAFDVLIFNMINNAITGELKREREIK